MGTAYTPGLRVSKVSVINKERRLPVKGEILVKTGDYVKHTDVVAQANFPGNVTMINIANRLGVLPSELPEYMLKKEKEKLKLNEIIAQTKGFLGLFKTKVLSPIEGTIENISTITGQVTLREKPMLVQVFAYVDGKVIQVIENEGVVVQTKATFIQGIFGIGGETNGYIKVIAKTPNDVIDENLITPELKDKIIVGGSLITAVALKKAISLKVKGVITGGFDDKDLKEFLGYELGVAITGYEKIGLTLIMTEGFGKIKMAERTFQLLKERENALASINGATQIRAGVVRPEIIIPYEEGEKIEAVEEKEEIGLLTLGTVVRVIREPYFGKIGYVVGLPSQLQQLETEAKVRVVEIEFEDKKRIVLPRANVEIIQQ